MECSTEGFFEPLALRDERNETCEADRVGHQFFAGARRAEDESRHFVHSFVK